MDEEGDDMEPNEDEDMEDDYVDEDEESEEEPADALNGSESPLDLGFAPNGHSMLLTISGSARKADFARWYRRRNTGLVYVGRRAGGLASPSPHRRSSHAPD